MGYPERLWDERRDRPVENKPLIARNTSLYNELYTCLEILGEDYKTWRSRSSDERQLYLMYAALRAEKQAYQMRPKDDD